MGESQGAIYSALEGLLVFLSVIKIIHLFADLILLFNMHWMVQ